MVENVNTKGVNVLPELIAAKILNVHSKRFTTVGRNRMRPNLLKPESPTYSSSGDLQDFVLVFVAHAFADESIGVSVPCATTWRSSVTLRRRQLQPVVCEPASGVLHSKPVKHGAMHQALDLFRARSVGNLLKILGLDLALLINSCSLASGSCRSRTSWRSGLQCATHDVGARRLHFILFLKGLGSALALEVVGAGLGQLRASRRGLGGGAGGFLLDRCFDAWIERGFAWHVWLVRKGWAASFFYGLLFYFGNF